MRRARRACGWTQAEAAASLGVSQAYVSQLESGRRRVPPRRVREFMRRPPYRGHLSPTALPLAQTAREADVASVLASLGYPGFAHLRPPPPANPARVLLTALRARQLEARVAEALPWLVLRYLDLDWDWLVAQAKLDNLQNRLGFVVTLARVRSEGSGRATAARVLRDVENRLEDAALAKVDSFCEDQMTQSERRWLETVRSPEAARWNLLTDLSPTALRYDVPPDS